VVLEDAKGIVVAGVSFHESDLTAKARWDEVGAVGSADGTVAEECGVSRLAGMRLAVNEAGEGPRESEERSIASAAACISVEEVPERRTVLDAEWE
jgi:hypothetical protein